MTKRKRLLSVAKQFCRYESRRCAEVRQLAMGEQGVVQRRTLLFLLAGTAAVALAAAYYRRRSAAAKRPVASQRSARLQQLLTEVL